MKKIKGFEISFEIGGYRLECYKIFNRDYSIIIQTTYSFGPSIESRKVECSKTEWENFWIEIDNLNIWKWDKNYFLDARDGIQWELMIDKKGRQRRRIYGSNKYPNNFELLTNLINQISKMNDEILGFSYE